jgi:hypothetical protein
LVFAYSGASQKARKTQPDATTSKWGRHHMWKKKTSDFLGTAPGTLRSANIGSHLAAARLQSEKVDAAQANSVAVSYTQFGPSC